MSTLVRIPDDWRSSSGVLNALEGRSIGVCPGVADGLKVDWNREMAAPLSIIGAVRRMLGRKFD